MLTDREIKGLKPESKQYKKYDGDGLFITITPAGGKHWKYRYKFDGKESVLSLGKYLQNIRIDGIYSTLSDELYHQGLP